jgi:hypothetical protein
MSPIMSGIVASARAVVSGALTNLFPNNSFESGTPNNIGSSYGAYRDTQAGVARTGTGYALSGQQTFPIFDDNGDQIGTEYASSGMSLTTPGFSFTVGQKYSISFWIKCPGGKDPTTLRFFGSTLLITIPATWTYYKLENVTATTTFTVFSFSDNATTPQNPFYVDDVWVVAGATAF